MPNDMKLNDYFEWCYDHDVLVECWQVDGRGGTEHGSCRNVRKLTYEQFIDTLNILFKDSTFRNNYPARNNRDQARHRNLIFIYDLINQYSCKSGNDIDKVVQKPEVYDEDTECPPQGCDEFGRLISQRDNQYITDAVTGYVFRPNDFDTLMDMRNDGIDDDEIDDFISDTRVRV